MAAKKTKTVPGTVRATREAPPSEAVYKGRKVTVEKVLVRVTSEEDAVASRWYFDAGLCGKEVPALALVGTALNTMGRRVTTRTLIYDGPSAEGDPMGQTKHEGSRRFIEHGGVGPYGHRELDGAILGKR